MRVECNLSILRCGGLCSSGDLFLLGCISLLIISGCAPKLPQTVAVSGHELENVQSGLTSFLNQSCVTAIDSDVRIHWNGYGQQETYPATLLSATPSYLRLALVDPLGRSLLLLAADGNSFTMADNRKGVGYTGIMDSDFIHQYLPYGISGRDLFYWLSGRIRSEGMQILSTRRGKDDLLFWYEVDYNDRLIHLLGLDGDILSRHLVLDVDDSILYDVRYSEYTVITGECRWPGRIVVAGDGLPAELILEFTRTYSFAPVAAQRFHIQLPSHFTVHEVE